MLQENGLRWHLSVMLIRIWTDVFVAQYRSASIKLSSTLGRLVTERCFCVIL